MVNRAIIAATMRTATICVFSLFAIACQSAQQTAPSVPASTPAPVPVAISLKQVIDAFERAGLPIQKRTVFDESTDPNGLLGRPNQYVEKMNFKDPRDKKRGGDCSIEIFRNEQDAKSRKDYTDTIGKSAAIFASYSYLHKNVLVRISFGVVPADADVYRQVLETVGTADPHTVHFRIRLSNRSSRPGHLFIV
jgi:hypothetical protein